MLKNAYLDAKIGVDTAENEPSKVLSFSSILIRPRDLIFTTLGQGTFRGPGSRIAHDPPSFWSEQRGQTSDEVHHHRGVRDRAALHLRLPQPRALGDAGPALRQAPGRLRGPLLRPLLFRSPSLVPSRNDNFA